MEVPVMAIERFAKLSGVSEDTVRGWIKREQIPSVKIGKRIMINVMLLGYNCMKPEDYEEVSTLSPQ